MRITSRWALAAAALALAACGKSDDAPAYARDGDTGAAAPATQQTLSPNPGMGDSTMGAARGTGTAQAAGDTLGAFGRSAGSPTTGAPADSGRKNAAGAPRP